MGNLFSRDHHLRCHAICQKCPQFYIPKRESIPCSVKIEEVLVAIVASPHPSIYDHGRLLVVQCAHPSLVDDLLDNEGKKRQR